jgi:hypothetical protein
MIPNLVNRVLMEHYSTSHLRENSQAAFAHDAKAMTNQQKETLTELLIAVIVEFTEPHFVRVALRREQERKKPLPSQRNAQDRKRVPSAPPPRRGKDPRKGKCSEFDDRAVSWATTCINRLIQPPTSSFKRGDEKDDRLGDDCNIPALDALLAASGPHDGMAFERRRQSALMDGLRGRRLLQYVGLLNSE